MKRRYLYALMYSVPALVLSAVVMVVVTVAVAGILWIFVLGDNPWPSSINRYSPIFMFVVLATVWLMLLRLAYDWGRRQEAQPSLNMKHVYSAFGSTAILILAIVLQYRGVR
jgi:hypothetical protein